MPQVTFVLPDGAQNVVDAAVGVSLMEAGRAAQVPGILAECGGECRCSTCHVLLEPEWYDSFEAPTEKETLMYTFAPGNGGTSRLSCQLKLADEHDGLVVHVPMEQAEAS